MRQTLALVLGAALGAAVVAHTVVAQPATEPPRPAPQMKMQHGQMGHGGMMRQGGAPRLPGQDAFGALAEVVRLLDADPSTDWTTVDLERLRQHLIDMNEVVLRSEVRQSPVDGGLVMEVTGAGRTAQAIRAMLVPHAAELAKLPAYQAKAEPIAGGVRLTVTAAKANDAKAVARVRALGFAGLLTEGAHHGPHHLAMARGELGHGAPAGGAPATAPAGGEHKH